MKKIFKMSVILLAVCCTIPVLACSQAGNITGGACSIKDIMKQEKGSRIENNANLNIKKDNNLRPVALSPQITNQENYYGLFGMYLKNALIEKSNELK